MGSQLRYEGVLYTDPLRVEWTIKKVTPNVTRRVRALRVRDTLRTTAIRGCVLRRKKESERVCEGEKGTREEEKDDER